MESIKEIKIDLKNHLEGTHLWHILTGQIEVLEEVVKLIEEISDGLDKTALLDILKARIEG